MHILIQWWFLIIRFYYVILWESDNGFSLDQQAVNLCLIIKRNEYNEDIMQKSIQTITNIPIWMHYVGKSHKHRDAAYHTMKWIPEDYIAYYCFADCQPFWVASTDKIDIQIILCFRMKKKIISLKAALITVLSQII